MACFVFDEALYVNVAVKDNDKVCTDRETEILISLSVGLYLNKGRTQANMALLLRDTKTLQAAGCVLFTGIIILSIGRKHNECIVYTCVLNLW